MRCKNLKIIIIIVTMSFCHIVFAHIYVFECMYTYMFISINHLSIRCYNDIIQNNMLLFQNISNYKICGLGNKILSSVVISQ
jgi:ABC-type thiamin/hydroxymethylpyrimidine transport system permease subunit